MSPFIRVDNHGGGRKILLVDTSASMQHIGHSGGSRGKSRLTEAIELILKNQLINVLLRTAQRVKRPVFGACTLKLQQKLPKRLVRQLSAKGTGVTVILSDFLQESFLQDDDEAVVKLLRFLAFRRQKSVLLHVLAGEELSVDLTGTKNLIDMEEESTLRLTIETGAV